MPRLTERAIAALAVPPGKREAWLSDSDVSGLRVRAMAGAKTFYACWTDRATGERRRERLGAWGALTLEQAREAARGVLGEVAKGDDPKAKRAARRIEAERERAERSLTLAALLDDWAALHLNGRRARYAAEAVRAVRHAFAESLTKPAARLTKAEAVNTLDAMVKAGKAAMAGRTLAYARACYAWAVRRDKVPVNPFAGLPIPSGAVKRDCVLSDAEVGEVWRAAGTLGWPFGPLFRLLLLTAQRREEVGAMRWSELSPDLSVWTIPASRAKNRREHVVHLAPEARAIVAALPRINGSDWVFTTTGEAVASGYSKAKARLDSAIAAARAEAAAMVGTKSEPMSPWRLHDFRRSAVTWMGANGIAPHVADKILNHVAVTGLSDVALVYQRGAFLAEREAALTAWAAHVVACGEGRVAAANVATLAEHRVRSRTRRA